MTGRPDPVEPTGVRPRAVRVITVALLAAALAGGVVDLARSAADSTGAGGVRPVAAQAVDPVFDPADAEELVDLLADATQVQGVCYEWDVTVEDQGGAEGGRSSGSGAGLGVAARTAPGCQDVVTFAATIVYTSESSDSEDSARADVRTNLAGGPTLQALRDLGLAGEGALVGEDADLAVFDAVAALPRLVADAGLAPAVVATPAASAAADAGELSDDPGSDFLRTAGWTLVAGVLLVLAAVMFAAYAVATSRRPAGPPTAPGAPPPHR